MSRNAETVREQHGSCSMAHEYRESGSFTCSQFNPGLLQ